MVRTFRRNTAVSLALAMVASASVAGQPTGNPEPAQVKTDMVFAEYPTFGGNAEMIRRMLSPLAVVEVNAALQRSHKRLADEPVDLADERFVLYVPGQAPAAGFALLVFVPPWDGAEVPSGWRAVLDKFGMIFVSAARSGNDQSVIGRRDPLALAAAYNVTKLYRVDPERVYIAGFSGGSRVALRIALAYPDLFHGAILDAGSDPIGNSSFPLPPRDLFLRAQENSHIVFVAGNLDAERALHDRTTMRSLTDWCIFNVDSFEEPFVGHDVMNVAGLTRALELLAAPLKADPERLAGCRTRIADDLDAELKTVESLVKGGSHDEARQKVLEIDAKFGGLAAPQSVDVFNRLQAP